LADDPGAIFFLQATYDEVAARHVLEMINKNRVDYRAANGEFATFDDHQSLTEKVKYLKKYQLGGIMFWELRNDTYTNGRLQSIYTALAK